MIGIMEYLDQVLHNVSFSASITNARFTSFGIKVAKRGKSAEMLA